MLILDRVAIYWYPHFLFWLMRRRENIQRSDIMSSRFYWECWTKSQQIDNWEMIFTNWCKSCVIITVCFELSIFTGSHNYIWSLLIYSMGRRGCKGHCVGCYHGVGERNHLLQCFFLLSALFWCWYSFTGVGQLSGMKASVSALILWSRELLHSSWWRMLAVRRRVAMMWGYTDAGAALSLVT